MAIVCKNWSRLWDVFRPGDILLADSLMANWTGIVLLKQRGVDTVSGMTSAGTPPAVAEAADEPQTGKLWRIDTLILLHARSVSSTVGPFNPVPMPAKIVAGMLVTGTGTSPTVEAATINDGTVVIDSSAVLPATAAAPACSCGRPAAQDSLRPGRHQGPDADQDPDRRRRGDQARRESDRQEDGEGYRETAA